MLGKPKQFSFLLDKYLETEFLFCCFLRRRFTGWSRLHSAVLWCLTGYWTYIILMPYSSLPSVVIRAFWHYTRLLSGNLELQEYVQFDKKLQNSSLDLYYHHCKAKIVHLTMFVVTLLGDFIWISLMINFISITSRAFVAAIQFFCDKFIKYFAYLFLLCCLLPCYWVCVFLKKFSIQVLV